jgi:extracellular elastinolytic metalloproteinase
MNPSGCNATQNFTETLEKEGIDSIKHPIFLVKRGGCSFVTKVRNIAREGGIMAIIIDTENEDIDKVELVDDGTGAGLRIPSVMITKQNGT